MLKRVVTAVALLFVASAAFAQHDHHEMTDDDYRALAASMSKHGPVIPQPAADVVPTATVPINITATSFQFSPANFTVNQGDTVLLTLSVPSNDPATSHGILMETYIEGGRNVNRGQSTQISFAATTAGTFAFVCNVPSCGAGHSNMFGMLTVNPVTQPPPAVSSVLPNSGPPAGGTNITISGAGFATGATVSIGGNNATNVNVVSATSITCTTPAHAAGQVGVTVKNPDNQSDTLANAFTYANPAPTVSGINPTTGSTGGGTSVTITGTNFASGATVTFGGTNATNVNVVSATSITATTPAHAAGSVAVVVKNSDNQTATFNSFVYALPGVNVTNVSPNTGPTSGATPVTITGTNFEPGATVTFGNVPAFRVTVVDSTTITALTPFGPANEQVSQAVPVKVTNPDNSSGSANLFTYSVPALGITGVEPAAGPLAGGNVIEIIGSGFTTAVTSSVSVGGAAATNVQVIDAVTIKATVPAHAAGAVDVSVTVGSTTVTAAKAYVYSAPPSKKRAVKH